MKGDIILNANQHIKKQYSYLNISDLKLSSLVSNILYICNMVFWFNRKLINVFKVQAKEKQLFELKRKLIVDITFMKDI